MVSRFIGSASVAKLTNSLSAFKMQVLVNITPDYYQLSIPINWAENTAAHGFQRHPHQHRQEKATTSTKTTTKTTSTIGVGAAGVAIKGA